MKFKNALLSAVFGGVSCALLAVPTIASAKPAVEDFATRPVMLNVRVSPDGKKLAYRVAQTRKGDYAIEVRDVDNLTKKPVRLGSKVMDITGFRWIGDNSLLVNFTQKVGRQVKQQNQGVFRGKQAIMRADGKGRPVEMYDDLNYVSSLPSDPNYVLVRTSRIRDMDQDKLRQKGLSLADLRSGDFYKMNVMTGALKDKTSPSARNVFFRDDNGDAVIEGEYDPSILGTKVYVISSSGSSSLITTIMDSDRKALFNVFGFSPSDPNTVYVQSNKNGDTAGVYELNRNTGVIGKRVFGVKNQDVLNAVYDPNPLSPNNVVGFVYYDKNGLSAPRFISQKAKDRYANVQAAFPGKQVFLTSMSRDESVYTVAIVDSQNPGMNYLVKDGGLVPIGPSRPTLKEKDLAEQKYVKVTARDGMTVPAYYTFPKGPGPHPAIVMPHGGPNVAYRPGAFDEWSQVLAANGYLVIDPLFRGTTGLGYEFTSAGFDNWGEEMSDDMDDTLKYAQEMGWATDDAAMFGWSFGGYSAMAASMREPQLYKCTIAGAAVSDIEEFRAGFSGSRQARRQLKGSYGGLQPIDNVDKVSVPILIIHGDLDQRVRLDQSAQFVDKLDKLGKPHKNVVLKGADHFDNTLTYDHRVEMYDAMLDFLKNDCGM